MNNYQKCIELIMDYKPSDFEAIGRKLAIYHPEIFVQLDENAQYTFIDKVILEIYQGFRDGEGKLLTQRHHNHGNKVAAVKFYRAKYKMSLKQAVEFVNSIVERGTE